MSPPMPEFMTVVICETGTVYITGSQQDDGYCWTYRCMREDWLCIAWIWKAGTRVEFSEWHTGQEAQRRSSTCSEDTWEFGGILKIE